MDGSIDFFSPTIYADGPYMNSIGILIITNIFITMIFLCNYMMRRRVMAMIRMDRKRRKLKGNIYGLFAAIASAAIIVYIHLSLKSLILNSSINLELYKWNDSPGYPAMIYASYAGLAFCILLQLQAMEPFFTTRPEQERSGMGFAVMQTFMDDLSVDSAPGQGTIVRMKKRISACRPC